MKYSDINNWKYKDMYDKYSKIANSRYTVSYRQDVTKIYEYAKKTNLSFYFCFIFLFTKAINETEEFMYTIADGKLGIYERRIPSFTHIPKGSDTYRIYIPELCDNIEEYCSNCNTMCNLHRDFCNSSVSGDNLIYYSCVPHLDIISVTNSFDLPGDFSIPRITWGKYSEENGKKILGVSVEVNHRFIDGMAISKAIGKLNELINNL